MPAQPDYTLRVLEEHRDGVVVKIRATPGASRDNIVGLHGDALKVAVQAPPENGKANKAIARLVATKLKVRASQVTLLRGSTSRNKTFLITGFSLEDIRTRLRNAIFNRANS